MGSGIRRRCMEGENCISEIIVYSLVTSTRIIQSEEYSIEMKDMSTLEGSNRI